MLDKPPEDFTRLLIAYDIGDVTIDELELLYSPQQIINHCLAAIEHLVKDWIEAALMLKELVISSKLKDHEVDYQPLIANSKLLEMSHTWLFVEPSQRKEAIIYVMGKLSDKQYLPILNKAFESYKDTNPFIMEKLMFELGWLEDEHFEDKFDYLLTHGNFVFRLSCIEAVQGGAEQGNQASIDRLNALKNDPHPAVVAAAMDDSYFFNLVRVDCKRDLYDQSSADFDAQEISVEQFTRWITEKLG
jgi:hypothetical protein